ncbi:MAG: ABC transporter permease [Alphaproteobacteria bacterium]
MVRFIINRLAISAAILWVVSLLVFIGCEVLPGDVAQVSLGQFATEESVRALRKEFGLDRPAPERYMDWLSGMVQGDWGRSITTRVPVSQLLKERLENTALLAGITTAIAVPLALILGLLMSLGSGGMFDRVASVILLGLSATPEFLIGTVAVLVMSVNLGLLPAVAYIAPSHGFEQVARALILPVGTLVLVVMAQIARMTRATITNLLDSPFIEMATLKGVPRWRVIFIHALINVVGPIANVVALNVAYLVSGVVVVETIFAYPGMARLMVDAVSARDLPVVQACAMLFCLAYVGLILAADLLAIIFNPRMSSGVAVPRARE